MTDKIKVNGKEVELPEDNNLTNVVEMYSPFPAGEPYFVKLNGQTINSILNDEKHYVNAGDIIEIYPLVIGG